MLNCLAIDDEKLALELLEDNIRQVPFLRLVKTCTSALHAYDVLNAQPVDLIFLDIQMPGLTGLHFLRSLPSKPAVILTTAYDEYALEAFDLDVVDYLLKPLEFARFLKAVNKARDYCAFRQQPKITPAVAAGQDFIFVKVESTLVKIFTRDIYYIEGLKDYVKIYTGKDKPILALSSLKQILQHLPPHKFLRIHNSYIVSLEKIESIRNKRIQVGGKNLPVSDTYKDSVLDTLKLPKL